MRETTCIWVVCFGLGRNSVIDDNLFSSEQFKVLSEWSRAPFVGSEDPACPSFLPIIR